MKVIGLNGSPHTNGNTAKLVNEVLSGASENNAEIKMYNLANMDISPCKGCNACRKDGICVLDDDMQHLYNERESSDAIVFGYPVYFGYITAQAKAFVDRLYVYEKPDLTSRLSGKNKKMTLAFTQGNPNLDPFSSCFSTVAMVFGFLGFDVKGRIAAGCTVEKSDILSQESILKTAKQMGKDL